MRKRYLRSWSFFLLLLGALVFMGQSCEVDEECTISVSPSNIKTGEIVEVEITSSGLETIDSSSVNFSCAGITVISTTVSDGTITAIIIADDGLEGATCTVTVDAVACEGKISIIADTDLDSAPSIRFENMSNEAGIGDMLDQEAVAVAFGDYDNDGDQDIYVSKSSARNRLWENDGNGAFTDVAALRGVGNRGFGRGISWGDYDLDGDLDLFVANLGTETFPRTTLYQNQLTQTGEPNFLDVGCDAQIYRDIDDKTEGCGIVQTSGGAAWGDYNDDGYLDVYWSSTDYDADNVLFRNNGDGTFTDVTAEAGVAILGKVSQANSQGSPNWVDFDNDGDLDLFRANEGDNKILFSNNGDGTFKDETEVTSGPSAGLGLHFLQPSNAQGASWADIDNDGDMDCYIPNADQANRLVRNNLSETGTPDFTDITVPSGAGDFGGARGCTMGDYDNDGDVDIYVNNGGLSNVLVNDTQPVWNYIPNTFYYAIEPANNVLYSNNGDGTFTDITRGSGAEGFGMGRGVASGDVNGDGFLDLLVTNIASATVTGEQLEVGLLLNKGNANNWIMVELVGTESDRSAIGARVRCVSEDLTQVREVASATGYNSADDQRAHFGLGNRTEVDSIEVTFRSGIVKTLTNPEINTVHIVTE
jgi:hypothetical protein